MDIGSIVVIKPAPINEEVRHLVEWEPVMDEKTPYRIRGFETCPVRLNTVAYFEEGVIGWNSKHTQELGVAVSLLIELLPPGEIDEEITEALKAPLGANCVLVEKH